MPGDDDAVFATWDEQRNNRPPELDDDPAKDCPVRPLGHLRGRCFFIDSSKQFIELSARELASRSGIVSLMGGDLTWLCRHFPLIAVRKNAEKQPEEFVAGFIVTDASDLLMAACCAAGLFGDHVRICHEGLWANSNGMPVVHVGDRLLIDGEWQEVGQRIGDVVYPASAPTAVPGDPRGPEVGRQAQQTMQELWTFRQQGGAIVALGVLVCGLLGAALIWRPNLLVIGNTASGKSMLMQFLRALAPLHFYTNDTTKPGLEQSVNRRAMPIFIDEATDQDDQRGPRMLMDLLLSSTGGTGARVTRGSPEGRARSVEVLGVVVICSIAPPRMLPQHLSRVAVVELASPAAGADHAMEMIAAIRWAGSVGRAFWGHVLANFVRFDPVQLVFRQVLSRVQCTPRQLDQMGAVMTGWWIATHDGVPDEHKALDAAAAISDFVQRPDEVAMDSLGNQMVQHLLTYRVPGKEPHEMVPVAELLNEAWRVERTEDGEVAGSVTRSDAGTGPAAMLRVVRADEIYERRSRGRQVPRGGPGDGVWLANSAEPLQRLFHGTAGKEQRWQHLLHDLSSMRRSTRRSIRRTRCGRRTSRTFRCVGGFCIWLRSSIGRHGGFCRGVCRTP